jgi:hypothetical protein
LLLGQNFNNIDYFDVNKTNINIFPDNYRIFIHIQQIWISSVAAKKLVAGEIA